jgi:hypothetical protein
MGNFGFCGGGFGDEGFGVRRAEIAFLVIFVLFFILFPFV